MTMTPLPAEVWAIIIDKLDTKSIYHLYESCEYFKNIVCLPGVVKECHFSLNTLAFVDSLDSNFFRDISEYLNVLNLSGMPHLTMSALTDYLPVLNNLQQLKVLDVSHTKITMPDYLDIVKVISNLKSLAINFTFGKKYKITKTLLLKYQQALQGLETVHFVGSQYDLLFGNLAVCMLDKAKIYRLIFTVQGKGYICIDEVSINMECTNVMMANLKEFRIHFLAGTISQSMLEVPVLKNFDLKNYELLLFQDYIKSLVYGTPLLKEYICKKLGVVIQDLSASGSVVVAQCAVMLWHKECTQKTGFFHQLTSIVKECLDYELDGSNLTTASKNFKWFGVKQSLPPLEGEGDDATSLVLNYDDAFKEITDVRLKIHFHNIINRAVTLNHSTLLKNLTHLSLVGSVKYSSDFFHTLFDCCTTLVTLQIVDRGEHIFPVNNLQFLPNNKSLKNIYMELRDMNFFYLFGLLSEAKTLENIYLINCGKPVRRLPNPRGLFSGCEHLYNICIRTDMYKNVWTPSIQMYKSVKRSMGKDMPNVDMYLYTTVAFLYHPYLSVFRLYNLGPKQLAKGVYT